MTELKTLKDLKGRIGSAEYFHHPEREPTKDYEEVVICEELRQEAIKWVKHLRNINEPYGTNILTNLSKKQKEQCNYISSLTIMHFFNLNEEELK